MAEPCALCSKVFKEAYRVRDRFGKPTQLGTVIVSLLDEALCENTPSTVCRKCRYDVLRLEKLKEYEEVKSQLKTQLRANRASQQLQRRQVLRVRLSVSSRYAHEDISSLESCLNCLRLDCLRTGMYKRLETVINSRWNRRRFSLYLRSPQRTQTIVPSIRYTPWLRHRTMNTIDTIRVNCIHNRAMFPRPSSLPGCVAPGAERV